MSNSLTSAINPRIGRRRVLADALPGARVRDALLILAGAGITALAAQFSFHIPGTPVPVTAQTLAVVLVGSALGTRRGVAALALYVLLGLMLPVYASGASGWGVVSGASGGYLFGFILAAGIVGWASEHGADRSPLLAGAMFALGLLAIYGVGVPWLKLATGLSWGAALHSGFTVFIVTDLMKDVVAAVGMPSAWRLERRLRTGD